MRRIAAIGCLAVSVYALSAFAGGAPVPSSETVRLQVRLDSVLDELSARDVRAHSATQRDQRSRIIATLRVYRDRGAFPSNYDFPGRAVPYFVDRKTGVLCAVAYLMESTGRRDLVDRVAATNNNVWVLELASDTAFRGWLDANGLTLAEAARIQVPYVGGGPGAPTTPPAQQSAQSRAGPSAASVAAVGVASLAATYFSAKLVIKHRQKVAARKELERTRLSVAPTVSPSSGSGGASAGLALSVKF